MFGKKHIKNNHPLRSGLYAYAHSRIKADEGASNKIFLPNFTLPLEVLRGPGKYFSTQLRSIQSPQVWFTPQVGTVGLGGIQAGNVFMTPLIDPANPTD